MTEAAVKQYYTSDNIEQAETFFQDLYASKKVINLINTKQNVMIRCEKKKESVLAHKTMSKNTLKSILKRYWNTDLYITPNTFCPSGNRQGDARESNLFAIYTFAIDIDYKKKGNAISNPLNYYYDCIAEVLPMPPNWIEYGHNLRLIYILAEPIYAKTKSGRKLKASVKRVQAYLCDLLNRELDSNAERQTLCSYYRVPGSINTKDSSIIQYEHISSDKYTIQEILTEFMPELPQWYEDWKKKKNVVGKKNQIYKIYNQYQLWSERKEILEKVRMIDDINREKTCLWYAVACLWIDENIDVIETLKEFNKGFKEPLKEKEIESKFRTLKELFKKDRYKVKNETIRNDIGLSEAQGKELGLMGKREQDKLAKIAAGQTREQIALRNYQMFKVYREQKLKLQEIADIMNISLRTCKEYSRKMKEENMQ